MKRIHVIRAAHKLSLTLEQAREALTRFAPLGLRIPSFHWGELGTCVPQQSDVKIAETLSSLGALLNQAKSNQHRLPPPATISRARQLLGVSGSAPWPATIDDLDFVLLSQNLDGFAPWLSYEVHHAHLVRAANKLDRPLDELRARIVALEPLGVRLID